jgi:hypothetical protein
VSPSPKRYVRANRPGVRLLQSQFSFDDTLLSTDDFFLMNHFKFYSRGVLVQELKKFGMSTLKTADTAFLCTSLVHPTRLNILSFLSTFWIATGAFPD